MEPTYSIGQLARTAGVPTSTVRYYERSGLLRPDGRTESNYRVYGEAALERLRFILAAKANGLTLDDVTALLDFRDGKTECADVQHLIERRLSDLETRLGQNRHVKGVLKAQLQRCREEEAEGHCQMMDELDVASSQKPLSSNSSGRPKKRRRRA